MGDLLGQVRERLAPDDAVLCRIGAGAGEYAVATIHRAENTDDPARLAAILTGLGRLAFPVVFPVHPRTRAAVALNGLQGLLEGGRLAVTEPLGYYEMLGLVKSARCVITDSGGLQKEAVWLGVPCVTVRDETEWIETLEGGWNVVVGANPERLVAAATRPRPTTPCPAVFGDGRAAVRIVEVLLAEIQDGSLRRGPGR
jgi:UDP-N-acetylglucosamine 2-epimerase